MITSSVEYATNPTPPASLTSLRKFACSSDGLFPPAFTSIARKRPSSRMPKISETPGRLPIPDQCLKCHIPHSESSLRIFCVFLASFRLLAFVLAFQLPCMSRFNIALLIRWYSPFQSDDHNIRRKNHLSNKRLFPRRERLYSFHLAYVF